MTKEDAKVIMDLICEKDDCELVISKEKDSPLWDYNTVFYFGGYDFEDVWGNRYSEEEVLEKLVECDEHMVLDTTKTIFVWQTEKNEE